MTDGLAVARHLEEHEPEVMQSLITDEWVFCNRDNKHDHRWTGPVIDKGDGRKPWTFRAFHPVRSFSCDALGTDQPRLFRYAALRSSR